MPRNLRSQKSQNLKALKSFIWKVLRCKADACVITSREDRRGKGGCDLFSSPSSQKQIIQQLIHKNNNAMASTSISLLDCTHLYEKFAVRGGVSLCIHRDISCVFLRFPPHHQLHCSFQYTPVMIYAVFTPIHLTSTDYDVIFSPQSIRRKSI